MLISLFCFFLYVMPWHFSFTKRYWRWESKTDQFVCLSLITHNTIYLVVDLLVFDTINVTGVTITAMVVYCYYRMWRNRNNKKKRKKLKELMSAKLKEMADRIKVAQPLPVPA